MNSTVASPIRVLIADDSLLMREALRRVVESSPSLEVCGMARNGLEAIERVHALQPDVVTLDIEMPLLDGIEALKQIMKDSPRPVIMVSSHTHHGAELTLQALSMGAFDYLPKSEAGQALDPRRLRHELVEKIEAAAYSPLGRLHDPARAGASEKFRQQEHFRVAPEIIAIGTSTGGPKALQEIIPELPADLPAPIIVVQHMPEGFTGPFADRLNKISELRVREAEHGEVVERGKVYVAPAGKQLAVQRGELAAPSGNNSNIVISLSDDATGLLHKPSVDMMMLSVTEVFGRYSMGIILTGMGNDGLLGMTAIANAGGITIGQDQDTSTVYGMPRACAENGVLQIIAPLPEIPEQILQALRYHTKDQKPEPSLSARAAAQGMSG